MFASALSAVLIVLYSPVTSREKPLSADETKRYAQISRRRIVVLILLGIGLYVLNLFNYNVSINVAIIIENVLLIVGKKCKYEI